MASTPQQSAIEPHSTRRRIRFRLSQLFVLLVFAALLLALYAQRRAYFRRLEIVRQEQVETAHQLDRAKAVLNENGLIDHLKDLPKDKARITVTDIVGSGGHSASPTHALGRKVVIQALGPAKVYLDSGKDRKEVLHILGPTAEIARGTLTYLADLSAAGTSDFILRQSVSSATAQGAARGDMRFGVESTADIGRFIELRLKSGDYMRGERIEFFRQLQPPRTVYLVVQ